MIYIGIGMIVALFASLFGAIWANNGLLVAVGVYVVTAILVAWLALAGYFMCG